MMFLRNKRSNLDLLIIYMSIINSLMRCITPDKFKENCPAFLYDNS